MNRTAKRLLFSLLPIGLAVALVAAGYHVGRSESDRVYQQEIELFSLGSTLGNLLSEEERAPTAQAYFEPAVALAELDSYAWDVPKMPVPFVGSAPIPGRHDNARINSMHFRLDREVELPKPSGVVRILMTGASTAFGSGAPSQDRTIASYLERMLTPEDGSLRVEVLPLATPAWATTHERILIENRFADLDPDVVVSFSGNNDVHWGQRGHNVMWFQTYAEEYFSFLFRRAWNRAGGAPLPPPPDQRGAPVSPLLVGDRLGRNVSLSLHALLMDEIPYVFALQPTLATTGKGLTTREFRLLEARSAKFDGHVDYFRDCYARIDTTLRALTRDGLRYVDLRTVFDEYQPDVDIFVDSYHYGDRGNERVAQALAFGLEDIVERQRRP